MDFYERPAAVKELGKFLEQLPVQPYLDELTVILLLLEVSAPLAPRTSAKKIEKKSSPAKTAEELRELCPNDPQDIRLSFAYTSNHGRRASIENTAATRGQNLLFLQRSARHELAKAWRALVLTL